MHMVMAVDMRRLMAEEFDKTTVLTRQLVGDLFQRQAIFFRLLPDPFAQPASRVNPGMADSGSPSVSTKCIPTASSGVLRLSWAAWSMAAPLTSAVVDVTTPLRQASIMP